MTATIDHQHGLSTRTERHKPTHDDISGIPNGTLLAKRHPYGFALVLLCAVLALASASLVLTPVSIGSGVATDSLLVGP